MIAKTMLVFYGADCLPYKDIERKIHYPIIEPAFQGASQVNEIKFYVDEIGDSDTQWIAVAKLPNGKIGMKLLTRGEDENGEYGLLSLTSFFTQAKGDLYISLRGYGGGTQITFDDETQLYIIEGEPIVQTTGSVRITIRYTTQIDDNIFGEITIQELMALLDTKLGKENTRYIKTLPTIENVNDEAYKDYLRNGNVVFDVVNKKFYQIFGMYPTFTYSELDILADAVKLMGDQTINGQKTFAGRAIFTNYVNLYNSYLDTNSKNYFVRVGVTENQRVTYVLPYNYSDVGNTTKTLATEDFVTNSIETIKANTYIDVDTTTYPTLEDFLASTGEEGHIYLYPIDINDLSKGYKQYIWESNAWRFIGDTTIDLSGYVQKTQTIAGITLANDITAQALTDALVFATTSDIEGIMED